MVTVQSTKLIKLGQNISDIETCGDVVLMLADNEHEAAVDGFIIAPFTVYSSKYKDWCGIRQYNQSYTTNRQTAILVYKTEILHNHDYDASIDATTWRKLWPNACTHCQASGFTKNAKDPFCPHCVQQHRCPRCGQPFNQEPYEFLFTHTPGCAACLWTANYKKDDTMPIREA